MQVPADRNDPHVSIPAAVRAAAARAETLHKELQATPETPVTPEGNAPTAPPEIAAPTATPPAAEAPPAPASSDTSAADWEHKFRSAQGRLDRATEQLQEMGGRVADLQNVIASLQVAPESPPEVQLERLVTDKDEEDYGKDLLSVVGRKAREELNPLVLGMKHEIETLKRQLGAVGQTQVKSARDNMLSALDGRLPNWREINQNQEFLSWLALPDSFSGVIRHELLKQAYGRNETARVLNFFTGFLAQEAAQDPAAAGQNTEIGATAPNNSGKVPLEALAAPGRAKTAAGVSNAPPAEKPLITRPYIAKFYLDVQRGAYRGRDEEKNRIENDIFAAQREGRIR